MASRKKDSWGSSLGVILTVTGGAVAKFYWDVDFTKTKTEVPQATKTVFFPLSA